MKKPTKHEVECIDAWHEFNYGRRVFGLDITCIPEKPEFDKIANYGLPRSDRKFVSPVPDVVKDSSGNVWFEGYETEEKQKALTKKFFAWRNVGYWFYNGDRLEFITGDHWYQLSVLKIKQKSRKEDGRAGRRRKLPLFIDAHRDLFYFWRMVDLDTFCFGMLFLGYRRFGKTGDGIAIKLNRITQDRDAVSGIQAQNDHYAKRIFIEVVAQWKGLPQHPFFFPIHSGQTDPQTQLRFYAPGKSGGANQYIENSDEILNSIIDYRATTPVAYDGEPISFLFEDEVSKWANANLTEVMSANIETLAQGLQAVGKIYATTTAENLLGKTLPQFIEMWNASDISKRNAFGQTESKLWRLFIPSTMGYLFDPEHDEELRNISLPPDLKKATIDEFGYSDQEQAKKLIEHVRKHLSGNFLIQYIRKYPLTPEEALMFSQTNCPFDTKKINAQMVANESTRVIIGDPVMRGDFVWEPGQEFRRVNWQPNPDTGKWLLDWMPSPDDRNQWEITNGVMRPTRGWVFTGIDPFDHKTTEDNKQSKGAAASLCLGYPITHPQKGFVCIYNNRPPDPYIFYEDMIKQAMFYSSPIMVENQKYGIVKWFDHNGFGGFVEPNPLRAGQKNDGISTKDEQLRLVMINGLVAYVHHHIGVRVEKDADGFDVDVTGHCPFDDLLRDWVMFNSMNWLKSDLTVASMLAMLALRKVEYEHVSAVNYTLEDWGWGGGKK